MKTKNVIIFAFILLFFAIILIGCSDSDGNDQSDDESDSNEDDDDLSDGDANCNDDNIFDDDDTVDDDDLPSGQIDCNQIFDIDAWSDAHRSEYPACEPYEPGQPLFEFGSLYSAITNIVDAFGDQPATCTVEQFNSLSKITCGEVVLWPKWLDSTGSFGLQSGDVVYVVAWMTDDDFFANSWILIYDENGRVVLFELWDLGRLDEQIDSVFDIEFSMAKACEYDQNGLPPGRIASWIDAQGLAVVGEVEDFCFILPQAPSTLESDDGRYRLAFVDAYMGTPDIDCFDGFAGRISLQLIEH